MVPCPLCGNDVDWVTVNAVAQLLGIGEARVRQMLAAGDFPGAMLHKPGAGIARLWKVPVQSVIALKEARSVQL